MALVLRRLRHADRAVAAELYWQAFRGKLGRILAPESRALAFFEEAIRPEFGLAVAEVDGPALGVAGFKTANGGFIQTGLSDLRAIYGGVGGLWRGRLLDVFERASVADQLLMDGLCVAAGARGRGIGTMLLDGIIAEARNQGLGSVRLDVIDSNPRARALYERNGFVATASESTGLLAPLIGFRASTSMIRHV